MVWPLTSEWVRAVTGDTSTEADAGLDAAVAAVNAYVPTIPGLRDLVSGTPPTFAPGADVAYGAALLAARLHARRGSILGTTASYSDLGPGVILRHDPDIARLLKIGTSAGAVVFGSPTPVAVDE